MVREQMLSMERYLAIMSRKSLLKYGLPMATHPEMKIKHTQYEEREARYLCDSVQEGAP